MVKSFYLVLILAFALVLSELSSEVVIERRGPKLAPVEEVFPHSVRTLSLKIVKLFSNNKSVEKRIWYDYLRGKRRRFPTLITAFRLASFGQAPFPTKTDLINFSSLDPLLANYSGYESSKLKNAFYLYTPKKLYWFSEYYAKGEPAYFTTNFIVHVESEGNKSSRVEIFEYVPTVQFEYKMTETPQGIDHYFENRRVEPTTTDRSELLDWIKAGLNELK